ncbi:hypothetical protein [Aeromonas phage phiWae14]|nr:hypothetical protein [Aeromonas phage phiWae14]
MNYEKIYNDLMARAKDRVIEGYTERHHIIPRCMGGSDDKSNIAVLTAEEHYVAHQLLVKMYPMSRGLAHAVSLMCVSSNLMIRNNKRFGWIRRKFDEMNRGENSNNYGKKWSEETKRKMSESMTGLKRTEESKERMSKNRTGEGNPFYGFKHTEETLNKLRKPKSKKAPIVTCPHCEKSGAKNTFGRSHFDKCKFKGIPLNQQKHKNNIPEECRLGDNKVICPHCKKIGDYNPAMSRYHFDNCKQRIRE